MIKFSFILFIMFAVSGLMSPNTYATLVNIPTKRPAAKVVTEPSLKDSTDYQVLTAYFEKKLGIPEKLLAAIAMVESKKSPWAINAEGRSRYFHRKELALKHIQSLTHKGVKNINVGYMQINLQSHGHKFKKLEDVLTPYHNIAYAAQLIKKLYHQYGSWDMAIRYYHSGSSVYNLPYKQRVFKAWGSVSHNQKFPQALTATTYPTPKKPTSPKSPLKVVFSPSAGLSKHVTK